MRPNLETTSTNQPGATSMPITQQPASRPATVPPPSRPWSVPARVLAFAGTVAATIPVWPALQLARTIAIPQPAIGAVIVAVVLLPPLAWTILGNDRRFGLSISVALTACVTAWAWATAVVAERATLATLDALLRGYLGVTTCAVAAAALLPTRQRTTMWVAARQPTGVLRLRIATGTLVWIAAALATLTGPVHAPGPVPPSDLVLPLPPGMTLLDQQTSCPTPHQPCARQLTIAAPDSPATAQLIQQLGRHLQQTKGWSLTWYTFTPIPDIACRPAGWASGPYLLCAELRVDEHRPAVEIQLWYADKHAPVY